MFREGNKKPKLSAEETWVLTFDCLLCEWLKQRRMLLDSEGLRAFRKYWQTNWAIQSKHGNS